MGRVLGITFICVVVIMTFTVVTSPEYAEAYADIVAAFGTTIENILWIVQVFVFIGFGVATLLGWQFGMKHVKLIRDEDGIYPLIHMETTPFWLWFRGVRQHTTINPNLPTIPGSTIITDRHGAHISTNDVTALDMTALPRFQQIQGIKALTGGRQTQTRPFFGGGDPLQIVELPQQITINASAAVPEKPKPQFAQTPGEFCLGYSQATGELAYWYSTDSRQFAVFGSNGTGKTASVAAKIVLDALFWEWHVIVLDPKRGADWATFDGYIERHDSGPDLMGAQLASVVAEVQRRAALCATYKVPNVDVLPLDLRPAPILLVIEELGSTRKRALATKSLSSIDGPLDFLMRESRYTGLYIVLIDQRPEDWPAAVKANLKASVTFKQGLSQGQAVGYYNAADLANVGEFAYNQERFWAWHILPEVRSLLTEHEIALCTQTFVNPVEPTKPSVGAPNGVVEVPHGMKVYIDWLNERIDQSPTQAMLRKEFGISAAYAHTIYHKWKGLVA